MITNSASFPCQIQSLYTYNFLSFRFPSKVVAYYLGLFPVFTLTSNYPLIAITLRNNMMKIFPFGGLFVIHFFIFSYIFFFRIENASWAKGTLYRQYIFAIVASLPSLLLAAVFTDVDVLVIRFTRKFLFIVFHYLIELLF